MKFERSFEMKPDRHEEKGNIMPEAINDNAHYDDYKELGGEIGKEDYEDTLKKAAIAAAPDANSIEQAKFIAKTAAITLNERVVRLYGILRNASVPSHITADIQKDKAEGKFDPRAPYEIRHYTQMNDQQLFAEALRMVGDTDSLNKFKSRFSNIFEKKEEEV